MVNLQSDLEGVETPSLNPLKFIPGCNTPPEVTRAQLKTNIERDLPWLEIEPLKSRPLVIVAGGASLKYRWPEIESHNGDILALNNSYGFLVDRGIIPNYWMLLDARKENIDFLEKKHKNTLHFVAAQCHPEIFDDLKDYNTCLYLTVLPETLELTEHIDKKKVRIAGNVGTVGMKALSLAYALGYRELHLYGYDSSYEGSEHHAFEQKLNDFASTIDVYLDGKKYITTPTMAHQVSEFCAMTKSMVQAHGFDINLHCSGLLPDMVAYCNKIGEAPLEEREREKYEKMWTFDKYRKEAPGESMVDDALLSLGMSGSIIDFGCGTGRAAQKFKDYGFEVTAVDFASNCFDKDVDVPFVKACLWELPDLKADYGYCTDVMEHIPIEKVYDVLAGIARCTTKGVFFNISTVQDNLGGLIGKKLHMTILPAENWKSILGNFWKNIEMRSHYEGEVTFVCKN